MLLLANIFQPLIDVFEAVLKFFHNSIGVPWGWSIVLLTVVVRAVLTPLFIKQFHSMQRLQRHQPELKAIQQKYKDDKQRQQQELMKFYKENNVNPFASCLPLALQLPVFISLFYMLRQSLRKDICPGVQQAFQQHYQALHHVSAAQAAGQTTACGAGHGASFLFIPDLTTSAHGVVLVILIILYVGTQVASSAMMASPTMDKQQQRLMMLLPVFFVFFIISFPAGVIVYWITTNAWTMLQQYVVRRRLGPMTPAPAPDGGAVVRGGATAASSARTGTAPGPNGSGSGALGGLGGLLGRLRPDGGDAPAAVGGGSRERQRGARGQEGGERGEQSGDRGPHGGERRAAAPPPSPRKKKKRSGRRR